MEFESLIETLKILSRELTDLEQKLASIAAEEATDDCMKEEAVTGVSNG